MSHKVKFAIKILFGLSKAAKFSHYFFAATRLAGSMGALTMEVLDPDDLPEV